jgi:hypothetical protein
MMVQARRPDDFDEEYIASKVIGLEAINIVVEDNVEITPRILVVASKGMLAPISFPRVQMLYGIVRPRL